MQEPAMACVDMALAYMEDDRPDMAIIAMAELCFQLGKWHLREEAWQAQQIVQSIVRHMVGAIPAQDVVYALYKIRRELAGIEVPLC